MKSIILSMYLSIIYDGKETIINIKNKNTQSSFNQIVSNESNINYPDLNKNMNLNENPICYFSMIKL